MIFTETALKGSFIISLEPYSDDRGWFARTYCKKEFAVIGHDKEWVQLNHSFTADKGTVRGMHFQHPPFSEIKMVRCIAGAVLDVIVDIRKDSPTFLQHISVNLSAANKQMIYIPMGFAHGFQTLEHNTELIYHHTEFYQPGVEGGLLYNDPLLNIQWPLPIQNISERDIKHSLLDNNFKGI
jgi:dTDP-4-dehydrorhamnose 3,5-epimerase